ncbi:MAG: efflux RND transporter periplasmic adaptor subunit [Candidatus Devosia phytovorans]|uniref:Efflux RND transporter periplasmic adaptor subunit n=1 Tax=Candidatus Devosia phytovorans TaxID=3121372 RepID=A0AAJ5VWW3_9HYPH|nr:efflux RND transporter periplasmic adaptor subunit [Devosia sp.]WEK04938.1 MAG: efflux RND transporter periplasmic adaptor subunit [Devosia sp.]
MKPATLLWAALTVPFVVGSAQAQTALTVEIVTARSAPSAIMLDLTGTIEATSSVPVSFRSAGRLIEIHADIGDTVRAGDIIARIESTQADAGRRAAMAQLTSATASLTQTELARERAADLLARGVGTQAELDAAQAALLASRSAHEQAQTEVNKAQQAVDDTVLKAPANGIVTAREAEPGQIAGEGQAVITIAPQGEREAVFYAPNVPELDAMMGRRFEVTPIDGGDTLPVSITEISPLADVTTGTVLIRARFEDGVTTMGLGTPISTTVNIPVPDAISLPWSALATTQGNPAVWRADPTTGAVTLVPIEIARYTTNTLEIASGLSDGDQVVTAGSNQLYPGRIVHLTEDAP